MRHRFIGFLLLFYFQLLQIPLNLNDFTVILGQKLWKAVEDKASLGFERPGH